MSTPTVDVEEAEPNVIDGFDWLSDSQKTEAKAYVAEKTIGLEKSRLFAKADVKTGKITADHDLAETSALVDWAFMKGLSTLGTFPELLVTILIRLSYGIAANLMANREIRSEFVVRAREHYQINAINIGQEIAYGVAGCFLVRFASIKTTKVRRTRTWINKKTGLLTEKLSWENGYSINGFPVSPSDTAAILFHNSADYVGRWIVLTESRGIEGLYSVSCRSSRKREQKYIPDPHGEKTGRFVTKTTIVGINPHESFARELRRIIVSRFVSHEKGGLFGEYDENAPELKASRDTAGQRHSFEDTDLVLGSEFFTERDKMIVRAFESLTTQKDTKLLGDIGVASFHATFNKLACKEGMREVVFKHFDKMIRNLRKKIRRFYAKMKAADGAIVLRVNEREKLARSKNAAQMSEIHSGLKSTIGLVPDISVPIRSTLTSFPEFWESYGFTGTTPRVKRSIPLPTEMVWGLISDGSPWDTISLQEREIPQKWYSECLHIQDGWKMNRLSRHDSVEMNGSGI
jgi:hypothetical protein